MMALVHFIGAVSLSFASILIAALAGDMSHGDARRFHLAMYLSATFAGLALLFAALFGKLAL